MHSERYPARPPRFPIGLVLAVGALALLLIFAVLGWLAWQFTLLDPTIAGWFRVALFVLLYGVPAGGAAVGLLAAYNRYAWRDAIRADKNTAYVQATVQRFPAALTNLSFHDSSKTLPPAVVEPMELPPPELPGPLDLAALDIRPSESRVLLGVDAGGPVCVSVQQLCHVALLGSTGGGKSNLLRLLIPQLQSFGASVCLADPHYAPIDPENGDDWRPIAQRLRFAPAVKAAEIDQLLDYMTEELGRRLEKRNRGERVGVPLFLAFDELPTIADLVPDAIGRIGKLLREGRKVHLLTIGASQSMLIKEIGGSSALRDQYRTAAYVGGDRKSASAILDIPEREIDDGPLGKGIVLLRSEVTKPARLVRIPLVSNAAITGLLEGHTGGTTLDESPTVNRPSFGFHPPVKNEPAESPLKVEESRVGSGASRIAESPQTARILALFRQGRSIAEIVKEITGGITSGAKYNQARAEVEETIRQSLGGAS